MAAWLPLAAWAAAAAPPDACKLITRSDVESLIGRVSDERRVKPYGTLVGQCDFDGRRGRLSLLVRPAGEFEATLAYARKDGAVARLENIPGHAYLTPLGLMLRPPGHAFFYQVMAHDSRMADDPEVATRIARRLRYVRD